MNKKTITIAVAVIAAVALVFVLWPKKKTVSFLVPELGECELAEIPADVDSCAVNSGVVTVTLKKEGDYSIALKGEDGKTSTVTIKYHNGAIEGSAEEGFSLVIGSGDADSLKSVNLENITSEAEESGNAETGAAEAASGTSGEAAAETKQQ